MHCTCTQNHAAVFREQSNLEAGCARVMEVCESFADVGITDRSMVWNTDLVRGDGMLHERIASRAHANEGPTARWCGTPTG